jgi:hypothetical protein
MDIIFQICDIENLVSFFKTLAKFVKFTPKKTRNFNFSRKIGICFFLKHWPTLDGLET